MEVHFGEKPSRHHYPVGVMELALALQVNHNLSYRKSSDVIQLIFNLLRIQEDAPNSTTIRQWVLKQGFYNLTEPPSGPTSRTESRTAIIIDETAGIGSEKGLMILEVDIEKLEKETKALDYEDTKVIGIGSKKSWDAESISSTLTETLLKTDKKAVYVISDRASIMCKAIKMSNLVQVTDCTHWMANCIERYYKNTTKFKKLLLSLGKIRQKLVNGKYVGLMAPNMRTKSRFLNLYEITAWMKKVLANWGKMEIIEQEKVYFLQENKKIVEELISIIEIVKSLSILLKENWITGNSIKEIKAIFAPYKTKTRVINRFKEDMLSYILKIQEALPNEKKILCCSDIIESYFGKFKNRGNQKVSKGITEDMLCMTLFNNKLSRSKICVAMEAISMKKVQDWTKENMVESFPKTKKNFWLKLAS